MGTQAWNNWRAFTDGSPAQERYVDELQSDVGFVGNMVEFGPYRLDIIFREPPMPSQVGPALLLSGGIHVDKLTPDVVVAGELAPPDSSSYHGGTLSDEVAALVSLVLGVRLRVAGTLQLSGRYAIQQDRALEPTNFEVPRLTTPGLGTREHIPAARRRSADLALLKRLASLPRLPEVVQVALVRAARSYATGLWWADEDPNLSWLQFVTAIEIAAGVKKIGKSGHQAAIRDLWPELWAHLVVIADVQRDAIAKLLAPQVKSAAAFRAFLCEFAPPPPDPRSALGPLDWTQLDAHSGKVYRHRSKALHEGKPFPVPMCEPPMVEGSGAFQEVPFGLNTGAKGAIWSAEEAPMLLSAFEYLAREALLRWWDHLLEELDQSVAAGPDK